MRFVFIGDVHGNISHCVSVCKSNPTSTIIQIGDLGVGFLHPKKFADLPNNFRFFVGNHDCREIANSIPHCLGDFGEVSNSFFFVSGADSIDKDMRIEGISWWKDEELSYSQATHCLKLWEKSKVKILVSHDLPQSFAESYKLIYEKSLTRNLLQKMIEVRKPEMVIFGHHHTSSRFNHNGIQGIGLAEKEIFPLDI